MSWLLLFLFLLLLLLGLLFQTHALYHGKRLGVTICVSALAVDPCI